MRVQNLNKETVIKLLVILILLIVPWSISNYTDSVSPEKITSDLKFYQINTCNISLFEFLLNNFNVIYQDHYKLRFNDYSSIKCFGKITGIDQVGYIFYISVGTNAIINLFLQSTFWLLFISLIKKNQEYKINLLQLFSISLGSLLLCLTIYAEHRFYSLKFFLLDITTYKSFVLLFFYIFYVGFFSKLIIETRDKKIIYLLPFIYLFMGLYSGWNIYFLSIFFIIYGIQKILDSTIKRKYFSYFNIVALFWGYQAVGKSYYLDPDKIRGLSNTEYNFFSVILWSYFSACLFIGVYYFFKERSKNFQLKYFGESILFTSSLIFILGYLGSSMPFINFFNYYIFGQTKLGTDNQAIFGLNFWGEKVAWRGFFPSAETIGEFFALGILIFILLKLDRIENINRSIFLIPFSLAGLYASNNRAAAIALLICIVLKFNNIYKLNKLIKFSLVFLILVLLVIFIRPENLLYSFDFSSKNMIRLGSGYSLDSNISSAINNIQSTGNSSLFYWILLFLGQIAFLVNRSELWGIFIARYNPNLFEFMFGTGSFTLVDHYSDIQILPYRISTGTDLGFLLPHSSTLLFLLFFGLIGSTSIIFLIGKRIWRLRSISYNNYLISLFIFINIFKSDSILYLPSLLMYFVLIFVFTASKNEKSKETLYH